MSDLAVKATFTADGKGLSTTAQQGVKDLDALKTAAKGVGDQSKASAGDHAALGAAMGKSSAQAVDSAARFKLNNLQIQELTYSARHLFEQLGSGTPITTILTTQAGHLSYAFNDGTQMSGLFSIALRSVWTYAGLAAGAVLAAAAAATSYENSVRGLTNSIAGQGNPFNMTAQQANAAATTIGAAADTTVAEGRKFAAAFTAANLDPRLWDDAAKSVRGYSDAFGVDLDKSLETVAGALGKPAQGVDELNKQINLANGPQTEHIKLLAQSADQYQAQAALVEIFGKRIDGTAGSVSKMTEVLRNMSNFVKESWSEDFGKSVDKMVPGQFSTPAGHTGLSDAQSKALQDQADAADVYGAKLRTLQATIAAANAEIRSGTLAGEDLANAHRVVTGATFQLNEAVHLHTMQLRALDPLEQARIEHIKSLIAGSAEMVAQGYLQADQATKLVGATQSGSLAVQQLTDHFAVQAKMLPYLTNVTGLAVKEQERLQEITNNIADAMGTQQSAQHYVETLNAIRDAFGSISEMASPQLMGMALAKNIGQIEEWRVQQQTNIEAAGGDWQAYAGEVNALADDKIAQVMRDDLNRRHDWVSGSKAALLDMQDAQADWANTSRNLTLGASQEFENDFVNAIVKSKDPLSAFFDWYIEQLVRVIYQQKLASSFNEVANGLTNLVGGLFGGAGVGVQAANITPSFDLSYITAPTLHGGGRVGGAGGGRNLSASLFDGAPRFHSGTGGLNVGERAAILMDDEYVQTAEQHRSSGGGAPAITFNVINRTGTPAKARQGNTSRNGDGSFNMEVLLDSIDDGLADRAQRGNSSLVGTLEGSFNLQRSPHG